MLKHLATRDILRIFTLLEHVSISIKIKVMKLYTLKVDNGDNIENIWSGNDINDAHHYENIAIKHWGRDAVWICNNMDEIAVG